MRDNFHRRVGGAWKKIKAGFDLGDMIFLAGVGSVGYGIAQIYQPAAWIVVGGIFIIITAKKTNG